MSKKLIITVRVNEYMSRDINRNVPFTPDEIAETAAECRAAGASIIHFHARNPDGGKCHTPEVYAEIVAKIREKCDILIDSTLGESVTFASPTGTLTINAGTGDDTININALNSTLTASLIVNGDAAFPRSGARSPHHRTYGYH